MKLKMWIGNLDGRHEGLVISTSKARAAKIASTGLADFNTYWVEQKLDSSLDPDTLYTRLYRDPKSSWQKGRRHQ